MFENIEYTGENAVSVQYHATLQFSISFTQMNRSTLKSDMNDGFLVVRNYGKLSAKFLLGTSTVIEKVGFLSYFLFLARTTIGIRLNIWTKMEQKWNICIS